MILSRSKDINFFHNGYRPKRAGIIPILVVDVIKLKSSHRPPPGFISGTIKLYGFGIDRTHNELTDFGGRVCYGGKRPESAKRGARREFREETLKSFENIEPKTFDNFIVVGDDETMIMLGEYDEDPFDIDRKFHSNISSKSENIGIVWLDEKTIIDSLLNSRPVRGVIETKHHDTSFLFYDKIIPLLYKYFIDKNEMLPDEYIRIVKEQE